MEHGIAHFDGGVNEAPSAALLTLVRAALVGKGTSLSAWARANGHHRQNVSAALKGTWTGPKATDLVTRVLQDAA